MAEVERTPESVDVVKTVRGDSILERARQSGHPKYPLLRDALTFGRTEIAQKLRAEISADIGVHDNPAPEVEPAPVERAPEAQPEVQSNVVPFKRKQPDFPAAAEPAAEKIVPEVLVAENPAPAAEAAHDNPAPEVEPAPVAPEAGSSREETLAYGKTLIDQMYGKVSAPNAIVSLPGGMEAIGAAAKIRTQDISEEELREAIGILEKFNGAETAPRAEDKTETALETAAPPQQKIEQASSELKAETSKSDVVVGYANQEKSTDTQEEEKEVPVTIVEKAPPSEEPESAAERPKSGGEVIQFPEGESPWKVIEKVGDEEGRVFEELPEEYGKDDIIKGFLAHEEQKREAA